MRRFSLLLLALSSAACIATFAATRPHYGGALRVTVREAPQSADPSSLVQAGASNISRLIFDTLVVLDSRGQPQPSLASGWQAEPGNQRWRFSLRPGVTFSEGTPMDATAVAASLRNANPEWKVQASADTVTVQTDAPDPELPAELALTRNAIARSVGQVPLGTGPFKISRWLPGRHMTLVANDQYWNGRPFLDAIEVDLAVNDRDQLTALDLGRTDMAEVAPENLRRVRADGHTVLTSGPSELLALVFASAPQSQEETHARNALAASVDTSAIGNVVLQGGGEPTGALLPNWLSGYAFALARPVNLGLARQERALAKQNPIYSLSYSATDPVARTIAERILLNARDAGITLQLTSSGRADLTLRRIPIVSLDRNVALAELARALGLSQPSFSSGSVGDLYTAEKALLQTQRLIPLLHLRSGVAVQPNLRNFTMLPDGAWQLDDAWLATEKP